MVAVDAPFQQQDAEVVRQCRGKLPQSVHRSVSILRRSGVCPRPVRYSGQAFETNALRCQSEGRISRHVSPGQSLLEQLDLAGTQLLGGAVVCGSLPVQITGQYQQRNSEQGDAAVGQTHGSVPPVDRGQRSGAEIRKFSCPLKGGKV
jgi:hypothetical protein